MSTEKLTIREARAAQLGWRREPITIDGQEIVAWGIVICAQCGSDLDSHTAAELRACTERCDASLEAEVAR